MLHAIWFNLARQQVGVTTGALAVLAQVGTLEHDAPKGRHVFLDRTVASRAVKAGHPGEWFVVHLDKNAVTLTIRTTKPRLDTRTKPFETVAQMIEGTTAQGSVDTQDNEHGDYGDRSYPSLEILIAEREHTAATDSKLPVAFDPYQFVMLSDLRRVCFEVFIAVQGENDGIFARGMSNDDSDTLWSAIVMPLRSSTPPRARVRARPAKRNKRRSAA